MFQEKILKLTNKFLENSEVDFLDQLRAELANMFLWILSIGAILAVVSSLFRSLTIGWQPIFYLHILFLSILLISLYKRKQLNTNFKSLLLIGIFYLAGLTSFLQFGLLSGGVLLFVIASIMSLLLLNIQYFKYFSFLTILSFIFIALFYKDAHILSGIDANIYLQASSTWTSQIIGYLFLLMTVLLGLGLIIYSMSELVKKLKEQNAINKNLIQEKEMFFSNMSHELRTPLNAILGFSSILNKKQDDPELLLLSQQINNSGTSLLILINNILDFSKIQNSKFEISPYDFNCYDEIQNFSYQLQGLTANKSINYDIQIDDNLKSNFYGDWNRINQILLNIISNALKFTSNDGNIALTFTYKDSILHISVQDDGIGMSKDVCDKVFSPFTQADGSTSRKYGGTGLGLSITQSLVEMMHGKIDVTSEEGQGSLFKIEIRLEQRENIESETESKIEITDKHPLNIHVLVAEDNKTNQLLITMLLDEISVTYDVANDGMEALEIYNPSIHALILMDENMPHMTGLESMHLIREKHEGLCTPIIALTANALKGDKQKFLDKGMDGYITKPIDETELYLEIKRCLDA